jgi:hypothetical protein
VSDWSMPRSICWARGSRRFSYSALPVAWLELVAAFCMRANQLLPRSRLCGESDALSSSTPPPLHQVRQSHIRSACCVSTDRHRVQAQKSVDLAAAHEGAAGVMQRDSIRCLMASPAYAHNG